VELEEPELIELETEMRAIMASAGLQWILDSVDAAISAGISSEKGIVIRHRQRWTRGGFEDVDIPEVIGPGSRERPQRTVVSNEPFTPRQRVNLLLSALEQAVTELPVIQVETRKNLNGTEHQQDTFVESIRFLPEEDAFTSGPPILGDLLLSEAVEVRASISRVLSALAAEVNS
jgi:hypothetical protein